MSEEEIRKLRGRIEWRHPLDSSTDRPLVGWCRADDAHGEWYVLWTSDVINGLGGMHWTKSVENFTALDANASTIIDYVTAANLASGAAP